MVTVEKSAASVTRRIFCGVLSIDVTNLLPVHAIFMLLAYTLNMSEHQITLNKAGTCRRHIFGANALREMHR